MIAQIFNSGLVSGPETLVLPSLHLFRDRSAVVFLVERRLGERGRAAADFARGLGLEVYEIEVRSRVDLRAAGMLEARLRELGTRIAHAHDAKATTYLWFASRRGGDWKRLSTHHGVLGRPDLRSRLYELFYSRFILPKMHRTVVTSREDARLLELRGLSPRLISFVANGITAKLWRGDERLAERKRLREELAPELGGLPPDCCLLGIVARLSPEKRHELLLRALAELQRARPGLSWKLLAIGSGPLEERLRRRSSELGLQDRCYWLGFRKNAAAWMPALDLLALFSSAEGLPVAAIEAGWSGVPVLAPDVGGLPELLGAGAEAGGLVFPRDQEPEHTAASIGWLIDHPEERERLGTRLQHRVQAGYSAAAWVRRMEEVYRSI